MPKISKFVTTSLTIAIFLGVGVFAVQAQNEGGECEMPEFTLESDSEVDIIQNRSFTYYLIISPEDQPISLASTLPQGVEYDATDKVITGVVDFPDAFTVSFEASNDCGTISRDVTFYPREGESATTEEGSDDDSEATVGTESADSSEPVGGEEAGTQNSVSLDEIPETGLFQDDVLTVGFYLLALLMLSGYGAFAIAGRSEYLTYELAESDSSRPRTDHESNLSNNRHYSQSQPQSPKWVDGIKRTGRN